MANLLHQPYWNIPTSSIGMFHDDNNKVSLDICAMEVTREYLIDIIDDWFVKTGNNKNTLATMSGVSYGNIVDFYRGKTQIFRGDKLQKIMRVISPSQGLMIPICGYVGAGEAIVCYDDHEKGAGLDEVEVPPGMPADMVAVIIRGDSMEPAFEEGSIIFYQRMTDGVPPDCVGRNCVVKLADDGMLLKKVRQGSKPGLYHLISKNPLHAPMVDQKLQWASRVLYIKPR